MKNLHSHSSYSRVESEVDVLNHEEKSRAAKKKRKEILANRGSLYANSDSISSESNDRISRQRRYTNGNDDALIKLLGKKKFETNLSDKISRSPLNTIVLLIGSGLFLTSIFMRQSWPTVHYAFVGASCLPKCHRFLPIKVQSTAVQECLKRFRISYMLKNRAKCFHYRNISLDPISRLYISVNRTEMMYFFLTMQVMSTIPDFVVIDTPLDHLSELENFASVTALIIVFAIFVCVFLIILELHSWLDVKARPYIVSMIHQHALHLAASILFYALQMMKSIDILHKASPSVECPNSEIDDKLTSFYMFLASSFFFIVLYLLPNETV